MEIPVLLSRHLACLEDVANEDQVFKSLITAPRDLMLFVEAAVADQSWTAAHQKLLQRLLEWLTHEFLLGKLALDLSQRTQAAIHAHPSSVINHILPKDLSLLVGEEVFLVNSLLLGMSSPLVVDHINNEYMNVKKQDLVLPGLGSDTVKAFVEFVHTGHIENLWKLEKSTILHFMKEATVWDMTGFVDYCGTVLQRYIDKNNVIEFLELAKTQGWNQFWTACIESINAQNTGLKLSSQFTDELEVELLNFYIPARETFKKISKLVTHIAIHGSNFSEGDLVEIISETRGLKGVDLSHTLNGKSWLDAIPNTIEDLDLSDCEWLDDESFLSISKKFMNLQVLKINGNTQLNYPCWSLLNKFKGLIALEIAHCRQVNDEQFLLILRNCPSLLFFNFGYCSRITEKQLIDMPKNMLYLIEVDASGTNMTDSSLAELCFRCKELMMLKLMNCKQLTQDGIASIKSLKPHLKVLSEAI